MLLLRLLGMFALIAIGVGVGAFIFTGDRRYLVFARRVFVYGIAAGLMIFVLLAAERLLVLPF